MDEGVSRVVDGWGGGVGGRKGGERMEVFMGGNCAGVDPGSSVVLEGESLGGAVSC